MSIVPDRHYNTTIERFFVGCFKINYSYSCVYFKLFFGLSACLSAITVISI